MKDYMRSYVEIVMHSVEKEGFQNIFIICLFSQAAAAAAAAAPLQAGACGSFCAFLFIYLFFLSLIVV